MFNNSLKKSAGVRAFIIAVLGAILLIPASLVDNITKERQDRNKDAVQEVGGKWGMPQTICGPILTIPFYSKDSNQSIAYRQYAHFLPEELIFKNELAPEIRYLGIYEAVLYNAGIRVTAKFAQPNFADLGIDPGSVLWNEAKINIGITDMKGIKEKIVAKWNGGEILANPGIQNTAIVSSGVNIKAPIDPNIPENYFETTISINGSQDLSFIPIGKETNAEVSSNWSNPSFNGEFLPYERNISTAGFTAKWKIFNLNRNFPQQWVGNAYSVEKSAFSVGLLMPVDSYQKASRTTKYAIMFIFLTFISLFLTEIIIKKPIHPIQYLFIGAAICLFY